MIEDKDKQASDYKSMPRGVAVTMVVVSALASSGSIIYFSEMFIDNAKDDFTISVLVAIFVGVLSGITAALAIMSFCDTAVMECDATDD